MQVNLIISLGKIPAEFEHFLKDFDDDFPFKSTFDYT